MKRKNKKSVESAGLSSRVRETMLAVSLELANAMENHDPLNSTHEAYSVILEELCEFWDQVKLHAEQRSAFDMRNELLQVAAMAVRAIVDLELDHK